MTFNVGETYTMESVIKEVCYTYNRALIIWSMIIISLCILRLILSIIRWSKVRKNPQWQKESQWYDFLNERVYNLMEITAFLLALYVGVIGLL